MTARRGWPDHMRQRAYALWCGAGACNAARTARLLRQELTDDGPGGPGPGSSTIRRWSAQEQWKDWVGANPPPLRGRDLSPWTTMWRSHLVRQVETALRVQNDIITGRFDGDLSGAESSLTTAASSMEQLLEQPGVLALLRIDLSWSQTRSMSLPEREHRLRKRLLRQRKER